MTAVSRARLLVAAAMFAALVVVVLVWFRTTGSPHSRVVGDSPSHKSWKTIAYGGVQVDVPAAWERPDTSDCEFRSERWAPPDSPHCDFEEGVAFYVSATFDPAHGPGVRHTTENDAPAWGGYAYAGEFAVYASSGDRDLVRDVLATTRDAG